MGGGGTIYIYIYTYIHMYMPLVATSKAAATRKRQVGPHSEKTCVLRAGRRPLPVPQREVVEDLDGLEVKGLGRTVLAYL